jgi:hypothetical protein
MMKSAYNISAITLFHPSLQAQKELQTPAINMAALAVETGPLHQGWMHKQGETIDNDIMIIPLSELCSHISPQSGILAM